MRLVRPAGVDVLRPPPCGQYYCGKPGMTETAARADGGDAVDELLELSDERDQHQRRLLDAERRAYLDGYREGRQDAVRELDAQWSVTPSLRIPVDPAFAELERRRWGPGGRERFGDPRPGDWFPRMEAAS